MHRKNSLIYIRILLRLYILHLRIKLLGALDTAICNIRRNKNKENRK